MYNEQSMRGWQSVATAAGHVCLSSEASGRLLAATHVLQKDKNQQKCGMMGVKKSIIKVFFGQMCLPSDSTVQDLWMFEFVAQIHR